MYPDDVASARLYDDLCEGIAMRGWQVTAFPSNRAAWHPSRKFPKRENRRGVEIRRIWRPAASGASMVGRMWNAVWINLAWILKAFTQKTDAVIIGTDPIFGVLVAPVWRLCNPSAIIIHWCHDVYPDAAISDGIISEKNVLIKFVNRLLNKAYSCCDIVVDLGPCMRKKMDARIPDGSRKATISPWAIYEPDSASLTREQDENSSAKREYLRLTSFSGAILVLMYSGNMGRAHSFDEFLKLARELRGSPIHFVFGARGLGASILKNRLDSGDDNVTLSGFVPEEVLPDRLIAADIHLASLRREWVGAVVPSKFLGSLAVGRPVIFAGPADSSIALWIKKYEVGWVINDDESIKNMAATLIELSRHPDTLADLQKRCQEVYFNHFSKSISLAEWGQLLGQSVEHRQC